MSGITDLVSLHSSSVHTAMHCRSFRDDDILKCLEQFCSVYVSRTYPKRVTLPKTALCMMKVANTTLLLFRVGSSPFGFILPAQRQHFLHVSQLCECCLGASLAETNQSAGCIFPYETRGACWIFAMVFWKFFPGLRCFPFAITVRPPFGGDLAL